MSNNHFRNAVVAMARFALAAIVTTAVFGATAYPAAAADLDPDQQTLVVQSTGLDLASPEGRQALKHRVAIAARKVCNYPGEAPAPNADAFVECYRAALRGAQPQVDKVIALATRSSLVASVAR